MHPSPRLKLTKCLWENELTLNIEIVVDGDRAEPADCAMAAQVLLETSGSAVDGEIDFGVNELEKFTRRSSGCILREIRYCAFADDHPCRGYLHVG